MRFEEALKAMREGKKVRLNYWSDDECIFIKDNCIWETRMCKGIVYSVPSDFQTFNDEVLSEDWEIYDDFPYEIDEELVKKKFIFTKE